MAAWNRVSAARSKRSLWWLMLKRDRSWSASTRKRHTSRIWAVARGTGQISRKRRVIRVASGIVGCMLSPPRSWKRRGGAAK